MSTTVTVKNIWHGAVSILKQSGIDTPVADARLLVQHALGLSHEEMLMHGSREVTIDEQALLDSLLQRRLDREPVSRIVGHRAFWKADFIVTPDTLDPRADSETLIEGALQHVQPGQGEAPLRLLDLGTGTGCLLISLLQEWPQATGVGLDINAGASETAVLNAQTIGVAGRAQMITADWVDYTPADLFDVVISNPPYIAPEEAPDLAPEVIDFDPPVALFASGGGLDAYRSIFKQLTRWLKPDGWLILEIGHSQAEAVARLAIGAGLSVVETRRDLAGHPRAVIARMSGLRVV